MNLNNLADRKSDLEKLKASEESIKDMEDKMSKNLPFFNVRETRPLNDGHVDITIPFKQSTGQSKDYFFSKFKVELYKIKPLEQGQSYFVITPKADGKNDVKKLDHVIDAVEQFKNREKECELAVGKDIASKKTLASMLNGEINYVLKDFRNAIFGKPLEQTFFTENGKGFTFDQATNLIQGRHVHRSDIVLHTTGEILKAWVSLDIEAGKNGLNFKMKNFYDPAYGFDLSKVLNDFNIVELRKPETREPFEEQLRNGDRVVGTVERGGKTESIQIETAIRYFKINFFNLDGKPEKREQFLKTPAVQNNLSAEKGKSKDKTQAQNQELSR